MLVLGGVVLAQVSPNFDLHWSLLDSGGSTRRSASAQLLDAMGQWAGGSASSASYRLESGFWLGAAYELPGHKTYMPLIIR